MKGSGFSEGSKSVSFGQFVAASPVPRHMFRKKGETLDFVIAIPEVLAVKYHFFPDIGRVLCFEGLCCDMDPRGVPPVRYILLGMTHQVDRGGPATAKCILLQASAYEDLVNLLGVESPYGKLIRITCDDPTYQSVSFKILDSISYGESDALFQCARYINDNMGVIVPQFAMSLSETQLAQHLGMDVDNTHSGSEPLV